MALKVFNINNIQSDNNIKIKKIIYLTRTILYRFINLVWSLLLNSSLNFNYKSSNNKKKIAIHHWKDLNHPLSDYWWLKDLKIKNEDVLFFFKNKKNPATDSNINLILENKFSFRILNKESNETQLYSTRPIRIPLSIVFKIIIRFLKIFFFTNKTYLFKWQKYNWLSYVYDINYWYTFIKEENIIISKNDEYEVSTDILALASSIAKINKIGLHWSDRYFLEYNFMPISDVYFVWGKLIFDILRNEYDYKLSKLVEVGSTFHSYPHIENLYNLSFKLRQQIKANKKNKFIVCGFDRSNDGTALYSNNYHIKFYDKLIEHIELNDDYFLIIKPKNKILESVLRQRSLNDRFKNLISNERLLMLDSKNDFFTVAKSADISISLGLNTAGVLSALSGVKSVFWDPSNFHKSQYAKNIDNSDFGNKNIIYENITDLLVDLKKHIESDNNNFKLRSSRDAFDDFGAYNRIAKNVSLLI